MKIDLNYLNRFGKINIDENFSLDDEFFKNTYIRKLKDLHISGDITVDYEDDIVFDINISGIMVLPCAITLNDVDYKFETNISESIGKFEEIIKKNKNTLDISEVLWENIVLEIPIRVVSRDIEPSNTSGDGWELSSKE